MKITYTDMLKQLQDELDGMEARRRSLEASIAGLKGLASQETQGVLPLGGSERNPKIPPGFFAGKTPTMAYRDLIRLWPGDYAPPEIADAFMQGGLFGTTRTALVQAVHSVLKRERERKEREERNVLPLPAAKQG